MRHKFLGSVLMILGTSLGAGMLALPVISSQQPISVTLVMLVFVWFMMTAGAFALLQVNMWFPSGANLVSMAKQTLGQLGHYVVSLVYLTLLYCLICSYLSGAGDVLSGLFLSVGLPMPLWLADCLALLLLGSIVVIGIGSVDAANRLLMFVKIVAYSLVVVALLPQVHAQHFVGMPFALHGAVLPVMVTAFGFAIIVPSIRHYMQTSVGQLKKVLLLGSVIPFLIYLLWIVVVQGALSPQELLNVMHSQAANAALTQRIAQQLQGGWVSQVLNFFVSICVMTSFLGVSVCLIDFLADGLGYRKRGKQGVMVFSLAYLPPLIVVLFSLMIGRNVFYDALRYAGLCCVLLLVLIPLVMLYIGRYHQNKDCDITLGGRYTLSFFILFSVLLSVYFTWLLF